MRCWGARLTCDSEEDVHLAAVTAIGQVAEKGDPEAIELLQASLCDRSLTVSQTAALILVEWAGQGDEFRDVVTRLFGWPRARMQAATYLAKVSVKGNAQVIALLEARLASDSEEDIRLDAIIAMGQVAEKLLLVGTGLILLLYLPKL